MAKFVAEEVGLPAGTVRNVFNAWEEIVLEQIGEGNKVKLGLLAQLEVKIKPARKKRMGRNPRTGEAVQIAAKPASVVLKARVLKKSKDALPTIQKARKAGL
jgi:nucleoid DNA-binding protein